MTDQKNETKPRETIFALAILWVFACCMVIVVVFMFFEMCSSFSYDGIGVIFAVICFLELGGVFAAAMMTLAGTLLVSGGNRGAEYIAVIPSCGLLGMLMLPLLSGESLLTMPYERIRIMMLSLLVAIAPIILLKSKASQQYMRSKESAREFAGLHKP